MNTNYHFIPSGTRPKRKVLPKICINEPDLPKGFRFKPVQVLTSHGLRKCDLTFDYFLPAVFDKKLGDKYQFCGNKAVIFLCVIEKIDYETKL